MSRQLQADVEGLVSHLRYPMIVKHYNGYSSVGMGPDSRVDDLASLRVQVRWASFLLFRHCLSATSLYYPDIYAC